MLFSSCSQLGLNVSHDGFGNHWVVLKTSNSLSSRCRWHCCVASWQDRLCWGGYWGGDPFSGKVTFKIWYGNAMKGDAIDPSNPHPIDWVSWQLIAIHSQVSWQLIATYCKPLQVWDGLVGQWVATHCKSLNASAGLIGNSWTRSVGSWRQVWAELYYIVGKWKLATHCGLVAFIGNQVGKHKLL